MPHSRLSVHDDFQLELKLDHPLDQPWPESGRILHFWAFFPSSLGIGQLGLDKQRFFEDLTTYVRFQTPRMSLSHVFQDNAPGSPFQWLARHERTLTSGTASPQEVQMALREIRLFAAVFRSLLRDESLFLARELAQGTGSHHESLAVVERFVAESRDGLDRMRKLKLHFHESRTPDELREALRNIDDFVSTQAVDAWFTLLEALQRKLPLGTTTCEAAIRGALDAERRYRLEQGYLFPEVAHDEVNELYLQRINSIKKYVLGVLHLRLSSSRRQDVVYDLGFGIAAAVSMFVAVVLQLFALQWVGTPSLAGNFSTLFLFIAFAVGGYILKDRLKERLKQWFQATIPRWLFDRRQDLGTEDGKQQFGAIEETVRLVRTPDLPPDVARIRELGADAINAPLRATEDIIHYRRVAHVEPQAAMRVGGPEINGIHEILRFGVRRWTWRMDEPSRPFFHLDAEGRTERVRAPRTYQVVLVVGIQDNGSTSFEKYNVHLSRKGIRRIEHLGTY